MSWFEGIEQNTLVKVELDNNKSIIFYFIKVSNGIVKGKLKNGKIKKIKEDKIEDLEELENDIIINEHTLISENSLDKDTKEEETIYNLSQTNIIQVKTSFINKIDNFTLTPISFKVKEDLISLKNNYISTYSKIMDILNQFNNAKKINELDLKFGRVQKIIKQLDNLLKKEYFEEIDMFLAYILQKADISYFEFFKKHSENLYCLKYDIYFYNLKNNKYGFIVAEKLFDLYYLDKNTETEWLYLIKNIPNFYSLKAIEFQYEVYNKLSNEYQKLFDESIDYLLNKLKINPMSNEIKEKIIYLQKNMEKNNEYKKLTHITSEIKKIFPSTQSSFTYYGNENNFSGLSDSLLNLMQPKIEEELNNYLNPNGVIETYFYDRNFGFIKDKKGNQYYFTIQNIIDEDIANKLKNGFKKQDIVVCFSISSNYRGETADAIQNPKQLNMLLSDIEKYKKQKHYNIAQKVLEQILSQYPNNLKIRRLYNELINSKPTHYKNNKYENFAEYGYYRKAKNAKDKKDYELAIRYFKIALENNEKIESTIKDLALTYYESGDIEKSKQFLFNYENKLSKISTTYNFLENHYFAVGEYNKSLEYIDILLKNTFNKNKKIVLLGKKANCYIKLNYKNEAKKILEEILKLQSTNTLAQKLLEDIKTGKSLEDIDISSFGGGLSKFIEDTLNNYEEYAGVPPKIVETQDFQLGTLKEIRRIIKEAGKARPKERANYLLTEAKLMQILEPDKDNIQRSVLARYCNAMAQNHISENSAKEVTRFYYLEAFNLEEDFRSLAPQISFYLLSYIRNYNELLTTKSMPLDDVLNELIDSQNKLFWNGIIDMFIWNDIIAKHLIKKIFDEKFFLSKSLEFLSIPKIEDLHSYTKIWDKIREERKREYDDWLIKVISLIKSENIEILNNQLQTINELNTKWLSELDKYRLNTIKDININLDNYLKQRTFDDKERAKNYLITKINELIDDIKKYPTKFSYEGFKPLLGYLERLINNSFEAISKASIPKISIEQLGDSVIDNKKISLQLAIKNSKDSSPISNIEIEVTKTQNIKSNDESIEFFGSIRGGEKEIIKLDIEVTDEVIKNLSTDIEIKLKYNRRAKEEKEEEKFHIPIRLYNSENFEKIENPYASVADGGPVKNSSMFFGRDEYINNVIDSLVTSNAKSIIIYGQKRSGKSSVLYHLKNKLREKENAFCIDFSMGDIIEDLSVNSTTFYYQILEKIEEELEYLEIDGMDIPLFNKPTLQELKEHPTIIFNNALKNFTKSLKEQKGWENKKLVILIDEFTYIYSSIQKGELSSNFMKTWKAFIEKNYFSAVLIGQDVAPKFKAKFPNEFGVTEDKRLTYISEYDAKKLIENPIWDNDRHSSRYIGNAIDRIINYTSCSPYYLQMFCARVVDYMNRKKAINVTESDIEEIANSFIEGAECLSKDKFDNLFTAGDADIEAFNLDDVESILIQIAKKTNIGTCSKDDIKIEYLEEQLIDDILDDLVLREVVELTNNFYKIKVGLFQKWLLKQ